MSEQGTRSTNRLAALDAVRGLAVSLVVLEHLPRVLPPVQTFLNDQINVGRAGVVAFFLVSGFVISMSLERTERLNEFWMHRAFRLLPIYWITLALCTAIPFFFPPEMRDLPYVHQLPKSFFFNFAMVEDFFKVPEADGVFWTLTFELLFYGFASSMKWIKWKSGPDVFLGAMTVVYLLVGLGLLHLGNTSLFHLPFFIGTFLVGTSLYSAWSGRYGFRRFLLLGLSFGIACLFAWYRDFSVFHIGGGVGKVEPIPFLLGGLLGYAVFFSLWSVREKPLPKPLLWVGKVSYSIYLLHTLLGWAIVGLTPWESVLLILAATPLLGWLGFTFVEQPCIAFSHGLRKNRRPVPHPGRV